MIDGQHTDPAISNDIEICHPFKTKILEAKRRWATKYSNASHLWSKVQTVTGSSSLDPISHLLDSFDNDYLAANAINDYFT